MTTEQSPSTTSIKNEFVEVFTMSDLLSNPSSSEFPTVITEASIIEPPPLPKEGEEWDLVTLYDKTFPTPETYRNFIDIRLGIWKNSLDLKYFDTLYNNYRHTTETIRKLRRQAQAILEEADKMQGRNLTLKKEINRHVATIVQPELRKRLFHPRKVYPRTPTPFVHETFPSSSNTRPVRVPQYASTSRNIRCFQCNDPSHIKWYCTLYRCRFCKKLAPGHSQKDCPMNRPQYFDDGTRGYFDIEGGDDNLRGEC